MGEGVTKVGLPPGDLTALAREAGIPVGTLYSRLSRGKALANATQPPARPYGTVYQAVLDATRTLGHCKARVIADHIGATELQVKNAVYALRKQGRLSIPPTRPAPPRPTTAYEEEEETPRYATYVHPIRRAYLENRAMR